ncbi:hypothetical protein [Paractinoplanes rishiriensis]|uniref:Uncharacterized protein n=1 Tax=Paractinoplanes rishiriensis TaxID=1050105 RepID=A0A919K1B3_9ACTN|nr:hypothetical protein [Actinoplanes rishiriensis]GIE99076.1 hypothetical protein Ari01nite_65410 [Actinoplanes rishiriensis]
MAVPTAEADEPGLIESAVTMLRLLAGWAGTALGLLGLAMGIDTGPGSTDGPYLIFHGMLLSTGLALLAVGLLRKRSGPAGYLAGGAVAVAGLVLSALPSTSAGCCLRQYPERHGFPFTLLGGGAGEWHVDVSHLVADLIFWGCAGFFVLVLVTQLRPAGGRSRRAPAGRHATHAEHRAPAPRDENVGGLP